LRPQAKALYHWYKKIAYPTVRIAFEKRQLLKSPHRYEPQDFELLKNVSVSISALDGMYAGNTNHYLNVGLSAIHCINEALNQRSLPYVINTVLDLPSGYGRVLRFLVQRFQQAQITACEVDKNAVDYCAKHFGVNGAYSRIDLKNLSLGTTYDLIWCGSLITHLNRAAIGDVLEFFHRHAAPGGILVFTTHGSLAADRIRADPLSFTVPLEDAPRLLSSFEQSGFSYVNYPWEEFGYGVSLTSKDCIKEELAKFNDWHLIYFSEHKWDGLQDVYAVIRNG
jgi:SAM-dependent methyltransferase